jgi:DNA-binding GntR family transcriptional regulator
LDAAIMPALPATNSETETQRVFDLLKLQIVSHELPAGTPLNHSQLCRDLSTSRTPVREALRMLEGLGLVTTVPHRGSYVAQLGLHDYLEIAQIRNLLEPLAARLAAGRVPATTLDDLDTRLHALNRDEPSTADYRALFQLDSDIHATICAAAGNQRLREINERLRSLCHGFSRDTELRFGVMVVEHEQRLAALRVGDANAAEQIMRNHVGGFAEALPQLLQDL